MANRIDWLDGLRAYAIGLVVLVHTSQGFDNADGVSARLAAGGQYGVQLFFVISSATIYLTLRNQTDGRNGRFSWYFRRFFRIAPLYYFAILFYGAWRLVTPDDNGPTFIAWLGAGLVNAVFLNGWVPPAMNSIVPGGWSIAAEMTFYLLAPWLVGRLLKIPHFWIWLILAGGISLLLGWLLLGRVENHGFSYYWPPTQLPVFLFALPLIHFESRWIFDDGNQKLHSWAPLAIAISGIGLGLWLGTGGNVSHALAPAIMGLGFVGLLLLARGPWQRAFANRVAVAIGRVSYSMYITHFAVLRILRDHTSFFGLFSDGLGSATGSALGPETGLALKLAACWLVIMGLAFLVSTMTFALIERPGIALGRAISRRWPCPG